MRLISLEKLKRKKNHNNLKILFLILFKFQDKFVFLYYIREKLEIIRHI